MKSTGIVRRIDDLGRVVIPKETRRILGIEEGDTLEIYSDGNKIVLKKYQPGCDNCGEMDGLRKLDAVTLCPKCVDRAARLVNLK